MKLPSPFPGLYVSVLGHKFAIENLVMNLFEKPVYLDNIFLPLTARELHARLTQLNIMLFVEPVFFAAI